MESVGLVHLMKYDPYQLLLGHKRALESGLQTYSVRSLIPGSSVALQEDNISCVKTCSMNTCVEIEWMDRGQMWKQKWLLLTWLLQGNTRADIYIPDHLRMRLFNLRTKETGTPLWAGVSSINRQKNTSCWYKQMRPTEILMDSSLTSVYMIPKQKQFTLSW